MRKVQQLNDTVPKSQVRDKIFKFAPIHTPVIGQICRIH